MYIRKHCIQKQENSLYRIQLHEHLKTCRIVPSKILCSKVSTLNYEVHDIKHLDHELWHLVAHNSITSKSIKLKF